jgi:hypothetical protein
LRLVVTLVLGGMLCPCPAEQERRWKKRWWATVALLAAANAVDVHSSRGLGEANPLLRGSQGQINLPKTVLIKSAATGGFVILEALLLKRMPASHLEKPFAITNAVAAGAIAFTAARNYRIPRSQPPEYLRP